MARSLKKKISRSKSRLDTEQIRIFVAIAQSRTLTEAAATLQLPLFTVSRALKRLETSARLVFVRRDAAGLELTDPGREYFGACLKLLRAHQDVEDLLVSQRNEPEGVLRIATPPAFAASVLGAILPAFQQLHSKLKIHIDLYCSDWDQAPKAVHDVFLKLRQPKDSRRHLKLFPAIRQDLFASPDYLAHHSAPKHPIELYEYRCLGHTPDHSAFDWNFTRATEHLSITPSFSIVAGDIQVLAPLALESAGIALLPLWQAHSYVRNRKLVRVLEDWSLDDITFCALHSGRTRIASKRKHSSIFWIPSSARLAILAVRARTHPFFPA